MHTAVIPAQAGIQTVIPAQAGIQKVELRKPYLSESVSVMIENNGPKSAAPGRKPPPPETMPSEAFRRHFIGSASEKTDSDICGKSKGNYIDKPLYKFKSLIYIAIFFFQFVRFSITFHFQDHFMTNKPDLPDSRLRGNDGRVYF
ncbi:Uncharacterised protein [Neisseria meningitidis]|nr:Uncharacterised protein [Neisseria meningitidis]